MGLTELIELEKKIKEEIDNIVRDEVNAAFSAFGSIIDLKTLKKCGISPVYASSAITTGFFMYMTFSNYKVKSMEELKIINPNARKEIINRNIEDGIQFGDEIRKRRKYPVVIVPGIFFAKGWTQEHYMSLWKSVILEKSSIVAYNDKFHYSDGCVEEFLIGLQNDKELRGRKDFKLLNPKKEIGKIEEAIEDIERITGSMPKKLYNNYREIANLVK